MRPQRQRPRDPWGAEGGQHQEVHGLVGRFQSLGLSRGQGKPPRGLEESTA